MRSFDLIIIGTGSGNSIIGEDFDDWDVAVVERGLFGEQISEKLRDVHDSPVLFLRLRHPGRSRNLETDR